jgi:hypothetical protein
MRTFGIGPVLIGGVCGLAWATGLRGWMAEIAGLASSVSWLTFGLILLPGVVTGALLGWAEHLRRTGGRPGWRWLALSPLAFAAVSFSGGGLAVPLIGMAGGYALSGRGPVWARTASGVVGLIPIPLWAMLATTVGPSLALDTPRGAWVALYFYSFLGVLALACAIPHRPVVSQHTANRAEILRQPA